MSDKYVVTIDNFDGPLDLLLHLIKEQDIDIYDIKIEDITKQYLDYIRHMKELNLEIASEYLVMASELIEMKSKMLLPKKKEKEDDDYEEDPRELLIERLLAYKRYKEVTSEFKDLELTRKMVFTREPDNLNRYVKEDENSEELGVADLIDAFNNLLKRKELDRPIETKITKKELSVTEKVNKIKNILRNKKKINFEDIFEVSTKEEVIISFLSVLEMVKKDETTNSNNLYNNPNPVNNINNIIPNDTIQNQYINNPSPSQNTNNIPNNTLAKAQPEPQMMQRTTVTGNPINTPDFTETPVNADNNISYSNVNYTKKTPKKKNTITITSEIKLAMIIVIILLAFVFFFPDIVKFFRKIFLGISR